MISLSRARRALLCVPIAALALNATAQDDGDGGTLSADEETAVRAWFMEMNAVGDRMEELGDDPMSVTGEEQAEVIGLLEQIGDTPPPTVSNAETDGALQDLHGAITTMTDMLIRIIPLAPAPDASPEEMQAAMAQLMPIMGEMQAEAEAAEATLRAVVPTLQSMVETDFADDAEFQEVADEMLSEMM